MEFVKKSLKLGHIKSCALIFTNVATSVWEFGFTSDRFNVQKLWAGSLKNE